MVMLRIALIIELKRYVIHSVSGIVDNERHLLFLTFHYLSSIEYAKYVCGCVLSLGRTERNDILDVFLLD